MAANWKISVVIRTMLGSTAILLALCISASAACGLPQPRLLCAEYSQSNAVVIATVLRSRHVTPRDDQDYHLYTFKVERILRGEIPKQFILWDENSSARLTFDIHRGHKYLLFVKRWKEKGWWTADGCGHSGDEATRATVLQQLASYASRPDARISGTAPSSSAIVATETRTQRSFRTTAASNDSFKLKVSPGQYVVKATKQNVEFVTDVFSYEDANSVALAKGGCAQIQFSEPEPKTK